jgi:hypothetical protein
VTWESSDDEALLNHQVQLVVEGKKNPVAIAAGVQGSARTVALAIPAGVSGQARLRVIAVDAQGNVALDESDAPVKIAK